MVYLILAVIASSLFSIMMRVGEHHTKNNISMLSINYIVCCCLSLVYSGFDSLMQVENGMGTAVGLGCINGFFYIAGLVLFQNSIRENGMVLSSIFMKLGIMVPLVLSIIFFKEIPTIFQITGFVIAVVAMIILNLKPDLKNVKKEKSGRKNHIKIGLFLVLIGGGTADGMSKIYQEMGTDRYEELFLVCTFVIAFLLSVVYGKMNKQKITKNEWIYGIMLGVPNYFAARFLLKALGEVPAVVAYPTFSIGTIAVVTLTGMFVFKEKLTKMQMFAIGLSAIAVALLN